MLKNIYFMMFFVSYVTTKMIIKYNSVKFYMKINTMNIIIRIKIYIIHKHKLSRRLQTCSQLTNIETKFYIIFLIISTILTDKQNKNPFTVFLFQPSGVKLFEHF